MKMQLKKNNITKQDNYSYIKILKEKKQMLKTKYFVFKLSQHQHKTWNKNVNCETIFQDNI